MPKFKRNCSKGPKPRPPKKQNSKKDKSPTRKNPNMSATVKDDSSSKTTPDESPRIEVEAKSPVEVKSQINQEVENASTSISELDDSLNKLNLEDSNPDPETSLPANLEDISKLLDAPRDENLEQENETTIFENSTNEEITPMDLERNDTNLTEVSVKLENLEDETKPLNLQPQDSKSIGPVTSDFENYHSARENSATELSATILGTKSSSNRPGSALANLQDTSDSDIASLNIESDRDHRVQASNTVSSVPKTPNSSRRESTVVANSEITNIPKLNLHAQTEKITAQIREIQETRENHQNQSDSDDSLTPQSNISYVPSHFSQQTSQSNPINIKKSLSVVNPILAEQAKAVIKAAVRQHHQKTRDYSLRGSPSSSVTRPSDASLGRSDWNFSDVSLSPTRSPRLDRGLAASNPHISPRTSRGRDRERDRDREKPRNISGTLSADSTSMDILPQMLSNPSLEMSEIMKEQHRRQVCEQQITRLQQKILHLQQKIRVYAASEQHTKSSINSVNEAVSRLLKENKDKETRMNKKYSELSAQTKNLVNERKKILNQINHKSSEIANLETILNNERSSRSQAETNHLNKLKSVQQERDELWSLKETQNRQLRKAKSDNDNHKQELSILNHKINTLSNALEKEREDQSKNFKILLQEKEEQLISHQLDNEKLKDEYNKIKYDFTRANNENKNLSTNIDNLNNTIRKLNEKLINFNQTEREYKRLLASAENSLETTLNNERNEYEKRLKRMEERFNSEMIELSRKSQEKIKYFEENNTSLSNSLLVERQQREATNRHLKNLLKEKFSEAINTIDGQSNTPSEIGRSQSTNTQHTSYILPGLSSIETLNNNDRSANRTISPTKTSSSRPVFSPMPYLSNSKVGHTIDLPSWVKSTGDHHDELMNPSSDQYSDYNQNILPASSMNVPKPKIKKETNRTEKESRSRKSTTNSPSKNNKTAEDTLPELNLDSDVDNRGDVTSKVSSALREKINKIARQKALQKSGQSQKGELSKEKTQTRKTRQDTSAIKELSSPRLSDKSPKRNAGDKSPKPTTTNKNLEFVLTKSPNFRQIGLTSNNALDEKGRNTSADTDLTQYNTLPVPDVVSLKLNDGQGKQVSEKSGSSKFSSPILGKPKLESSLLLDNNRNSKNSSFNQNKYSNISMLSNSKSSSNNNTPRDAFGDKTYRSAEQSPGKGNAASSVLEQEALMRKLLNQNPEGPKEVNETLGSLADSINVMSLSTQLLNEHNNSYNNNGSKSSVRSQDLSKYLKKLLRKEEEKILSGNYDEESLVNNLGDEDSCHAVEKLENNVKSLPNAINDNAGDLGLRASVSSSSEMRSDVKILMDKLALAESGGKK